MKAPILKAPVKAVLFDLDGTLIDSIHDIAESIGTFMERRGLPPFTSREVTHFVGRGFEVALQRAFAARGIARDGQPLKDDVAEFAAIYEPRASLKTRPFEGVMAVLDGLRGRARMGVVTNKPGGPARAILADLGLAPYFDVVLGGDYGGPKKPAPDAILKALGEMGVAPRDAVMVGDSDNDIAAALAAPVRSVAVSFGYSVTPATELGADRVIDRFSQLPGVLEEFQQ